MPALDLTADVVDLAAAVCDVPSVSGQETALADVLEAALRALPHLEVLRDGGVLLAKKMLDLIDGQPVTSEMLSTTLMVRQT